MLIGAAGEITLEEVPLDVVDQFRYLGVQAENSKSAFKSRLQLATAAIHKMRQVWGSGLPDGKKIRLFRATIESMLLYGCESWAITGTLSKHINGAHNRLARWALGIHWPNVMTTATLRTHQHLPNG